MGYCSNYMLHALGKTNHLAHRLSNIPAKLAFPRVIAATNLSSRLCIADQHRQALQNANQDVCIGESQVLHQGRDGILGQDAAANDLHFCHVCKGGGRIGQKLGTDDFKMLDEDLVASCFKDFSL